MSKRTHIYTSNETCARLAIAVHIDDFRMYGEPDDPVKDSLRDIADRYRANSRSSFLLNGSCLMLASCGTPCPIRAGQRGRRSTCWSRTSSANSEGVNRRSSAPLWSSDRRTGCSTSWSAIIRRSPDISSQCRKLGIDRFSINERFSRAYGRTPYALHKYFRMLGASMMIVHGEEDMSKVAQSFGYTKESKFAAAFKKEFGIRPKHFREEYWGRLGKGHGQ